MKIPLKHGINKMENNYKQAKIFLHDGLRQKTLRTGKSMF